MIVVCQMWYRRFRDADAGVRERGDAGAAGDARVQIRRQDHRSIQLPNQTLFHQRWKLPGNHCM